MVQKCQRREKVAEDYWKCYGRRGSVFLYGGWSRYCRAITSLAFRTEKRGGIPLIFERKRESLKKLKNIEEHLCGGFSIENAEIRLVQTFESCKGELKKIRVLFPQWVWADRESSSWKTKRYRDPAWQEKVIFFSFILFGIAILREWCGWCFKWCLP